MEGGRKEGGRGRRWGMERERRVAITRMRVWKVVEVQLCCGREKLH